MDTRRFADAVCALLSAVLFLAPGISSAASLSFNTLTYGTAVDGGTNYGWTTDGVFDAITTQVDPILGTTTLYVTKSQGSDFLHQIERRAAWEFALPAVLNQPGVMITQATLYLKNSPFGTTTMTGNDVLRVFGYAGDGQITLGDFANTSNPVWSANNTAPPFFVDVTAFVQSLLGNASYAGFLVAVDSLDTSYELDANVSITIEYSAPANLPPVVSITAPAANSQFALGVPITFQGTATDPEGSVSAISWTACASNGCIGLGTGSTVTTSSLPVGAYSITAMATDNIGQVGTASTTISVIAGAAAYCAARGNTSSYEWIKSVGVGSWSNMSGNNAGYGDFVSAPPVSVFTGSNSVTFTPGFSSGTYNEYWRVWIDLDHDGTFGTGELVFSGNGTSAVLGTMTIPATALTGATRMRVAMSYGSGAAPCGTFSYGEVEDYTVTISAGAPPPPPPPPTQAYCSSKGGNVSYEWINQISLASTLRFSGKNGGYADFAATAPIALARGSNDMGLFPGFASSTYTENWRVWIDFNQDFVFSDNELVYSGQSPSAISSSITVPAAAKSGTTRARVSMKYGSAPTACETFTYGEVEDYSVTIP